MSEELLNKIFDKLVSMETRIANIETNMASKDDIIALDAKIDRLAVETQADVKAMLLHIEKKADNIENKLDVLNDRTFENEADIRSLKKAR